MLQLATRKLVGTRRSNNPSPRAAPQQLPAKVLPTEVTQGGRGLRGTFSRRTFRSSLGTGILLIRAQLDQAKPYAGSPMALCSSGLV